MWALNYLYAPAEKRKLYSYSARKARGGEGAKTTPEGKILLLPNSLRDAVCLKRKREFRTLRSAARAMPLTHKLLKKLDQNFPAIIF